MSLPKCLLNSFNLLCFTTLCEMKLRSRRSEIYCRLANANRFCETFSIINSAQSGENNETKSN